MAEVTAALVKELRDKTGAGMMDCKRALGDSAGDIEAAVDWLRKKGLAAAAKKAGRVAAEGLVGVATRGPAGAVVEVNSETDFVARNELFQAFVRTVAELAVGRRRRARGAEPGRLSRHRPHRRERADRSGRADRRKPGAAPRRAARRYARAQSPPMCTTRSAPGLGKIGVMVALDLECARPTRLAALGRQLAMHVAAANPLYLDIASVPAAALERERGVLREQARASGKPDGIVEQMVDGRLRKFYEEVVLLEQIFVIDRREPGRQGRSRTQRRQPARRSGSTGFARFALGEGIERPHTDFAAEVAAQLQH